MRSWSFLTTHARVLVCIAHDPGARLRDIAANVGMTERCAYAIVTDLPAAGYVVKRKDGRRASPPDASTPRSSTARAAAGAGTASLAARLDVA